MGRIGAFLLLAGVLLAGCEADPGADTGSGAAVKQDAVERTGEAPVTAEAYDPARDYFSFANRDGMTVRHIELDLDVDFERQVLRGYAILHVGLTDPAKLAWLQEAESGGPDDAGRTTTGDALRPVYSLTLDSRGLQIERASLLDETGGARSLTVSRPDAAPDPVRGHAVRIDLPVDFELAGVFRIRIDYQTGPGASAIMWLPPELTAGGEHPFMFTQSQSIHARSWIPLQDTPAVRFTYDAVIRTPPGLLAVMSADNDPQAQHDGEYHFSMPQPIPSYLMALAVGHLDFAPFGDRTGVYAEPEILPAAAAEFADTQAMLEAAEALWGPYEWGRYDLLILPPSFPYGGMENPRLSFLTPSLIAGDGSLVSVVAHELAHSWSGNLVSNATWRDIWLNEGMTNYLEGRLMEVIYDRERADEERTLNYHDLLDLLGTVPENMQALAPRFDEGDPDVGQDGVEYRKGQLLLDTLEHHFTRPVFDAFLRGYFENFAWQAITTEQFLEYTDQNLLAAHPGVFPRERLEAWLYRPGIPDEAVVPSSASLERAGAAAAAFAGGMSPPDEIPAGRWSPLATVHFLQSLPADLAPERIAALDSALGLTGTGNAEIARTWYTRAAEWRFRPAYPAMRDYLRHYGRIRLLRPVYEALARNGEDLDWAREVFADARANYHPLTVAAIEPILAVESPPTVAAAGH
ncbi:M1 family metallopeptidase [Elongatibacter sediminis]